MNNIMKGAFVAQLLIGIALFVHNFTYFSIPNWIYWIYAALIIGLFLTWQAFFNKDLNKSTKIWAIVIGTIPMVFILGFWALLATSLH